MVASFTRYIFLATLLLLSGTDAFEASGADPRRRTPDVEGMKAENSDVFSVVHIMTTELQWGVAWYQDYIYYGTVTCVRRVEYLTNTATDFSGDCGTAGTTVDTVLRTNNKMSDVREIFWDATNSHFVISQAMSHQIMLMFTDTNSQVLAGSGSTGSNDANGMTATFNQPHGGVQYSPNSYIFADQNNHRLRVVTTGGDVSNFGPAGVSGCAEGSSGTGNLNSPYSVLMASDGFMYVTSKGSHVVFRYDGNDRQLKYAFGVCNSASNYIGYGITDDFYKANTEVTIRSPLVLLEDKRRNVLYLSSDDEDFLTRVEPRGGYRTTLITLNTWTTGTITEGRMHSQMGSKGLLGSGCNGMAANEYGDIFCTLSQASGLIELQRGRTLAHYRLHGDGFDSSGNAMHATSVGSGVSPTADRYGEAGKALQFDGTTNAYMVLPNALMAGLVSYSICVYVQAASFTVSVVSVADATLSPRVALDLQTTAAYHILGGTSHFYNWPDDGTVLNSGWNHICAIRDGNSLSVSINGWDRYDMGGSVAQAYRIDPGGIVVGQKQSSVLGGYSNSFDGKMSDLTFYNYAPSLAELQYFMRDTYPAQDQEIWSVEYRSGGPSAATMDFTYQSYYTSLSGHASSLLWDPFMFAQDIIGDLLVADQHQVLKLPMDGNLVTGTVVSYSGDAASGLQSGAASSTRYTNIKWIINAGILVGHYAFTPTRLYQLYNDDTGDTGTVCDYTDGFTNGACGGGAQLSSTATYPFVEGDTNEYWFTDETNHVIRLYQVGGGFSTIIGQDGVSGCTEAAGTSARLSKPTHMTLGGYFDLAYVVMSREGQGIARIKMTTKDVTFVIGWCNANYGSWEASFANEGFGRQALVAAGNAITHFNTAVSQVAAFAIYQMGYDDSRLLRYKTGTQQLITVAPRKEVDDNTAISGRAFHGGFNAKNVKSLFTVYSDIMSTTSSVVVAYRYGELRMHFPLRNSWYDQIGLADDNSLGDFVGSFPAFHNVGGTLARGTDRFGRRGMATRFTGATTDTGEIDRRILNAYGSFTTCMWVRPECTSCVIISAEGTAMTSLDFEFGFGTTGTMYAHLGNNAVTYQADATRRTEYTYQFACAVINGPHIHIASDGKIIAAGKINSSPRYVLTPSFVGLGQRMDVGTSGLYVAGKSFLGDMHDAYVFNYALTEDELMELMDRDAIEEEIWTTHTIGGSQLNIGFSVDDTGDDMQFTMRITATVFYSDTNYVLVAEKEGACIRKIPIDGLTTSTTFSGLCGTPGCQFGSAGASRMDSVFNLRWDAPNDRYLMGGETNYAAVLAALNTDGSTSLLCGVNGSPGGTGTTCSSASTLNSAVPAVIVGTNKYLVGLSAARTIRFIDGTTVSTVVGKDGMIGCVEGAGADARISDIKSLTSDDQGNAWFVADGIFSQIGRIAAATIGTTYEVRFPVTSCVPGQNIIFAVGPPTITLRAYDSGKSQVPMLSHIDFDQQTNSLLLGMWQGGVALRVNLNNYRMSFIERAGISHFDGRAGHRGSIFGPIGSVVKHPTSGSLILSTDEGQVFEYIPGVMRARYKFESNALDNSGNGHTATLGSGVSTANPNWVQLDGTTNAYIVIPNDAFDRVADYSVCLWHQTSSYTDAATTIFSVVTLSGTDHVRFYHTYSAGTLTFLYDHGIASPVSTQWDFANPGTKETRDSWHHMCIIKDGALLHLYIDATQRSNAMNPSFPLPNVGTGVQQVTGVVVGQRQGVALGSYTESSSGYLRDFRVYNYALLQHEVDRISAETDSPNNWNIRIIAGDSVTAPHEYVFGAGTGEDVSLNDIIAVAGLSSMGGTSDLAMYDQGTRLLYRVTMEGQVSVLAGTPSQPSFAGNSLFDLVEDTAGGFLVAAALGCIYKINGNTGDYVIHVGPANCASGSFDGTGSGALITAKNIAIWDSNNYYFSETSNHQIKHIATDGVAPPAATNNGVVTIYVGTSDGCQPGTGHDPLGGPPTAEVSQPTAMVKGASYIYVIEAGGKAIVPFDDAYWVSSVIGDCSASGYQDGDYDSALFTSLTCVAYDASRSMLVLGDTRIRTYVGTEAHSITFQDGIDIHYSEGRLGYGGFASFQYTTRQYVNQGSVYAGGQGCVYELYAGQLVAKYFMLSSTDASGNGHDMTTYTLTSYGLFDGTTATWAQVPNSAFQAVHSYTICTSVSITTDTDVTFFSIATSGDTRYIDFSHVGGTTYFRHGGKEFATRYNIANQGTQRYCLVRNGQQLQMYHNGLGLQSFPNPGRLPTGGRVTSLGFTLGQAQQSVLGDFLGMMSLNGRMSDLEIYSYAFNAPEAEAYAGFDSTTTITVPEVPSYTEPPTTSTTLSVPLTPSATFIPSATLLPPPTGTPSLTASETHPETVVATVTPPPSSTSTTSLANSVSQSLTASLTPPRSASQVDSATQSTTANPSTSQPASRTLSESTPKTATAASTATPSVTIPLTPPPSDTDVPTASQTSSQPASRTLSESTPKTTTATTTAAPSASVGPSQTSTATPSLSASSIPSSTATATMTNTQEPSSTASPSVTTSPAATASQEPTVTQSPTATTTLTTSPTLPATATVVPTQSVTPTATGTSASSASLAPTDTIEPTRTVTTTTPATQTPQPTETQSTTPTTSDSHVVTQSLSQFPTPTGMSTPTRVETPAVTETAQPTNTAGLTTTPETTASQTIERTSTEPATKTVEPTRTQSPEPTLTVPPTATVEPTATSKPTATVRATESQNPTDSSTTSESMSVSQRSRTRSRTHVYTLTRKLTITRHMYSPTAVATETVLPPPPTMAPPPKPTEPVEKLFVQPKRPVYVELYAGRLASENTTKPGGIVTMNATVVPAPSTGPYKGVEVLFSFSTGNLYEASFSSGSCVQVGRATVVRCKTNQRFDKQSAPYVALVSVLLPPDLSLPHVFKAAIEARVDGSRAPFAIHKYTHQLSVAQAIPKHFSDVSVPLNEITLGSSTQIVGSSVQNLPRYVLLGPFIVTVVCVNSTVANLSLPTSTDIDSSLLQCPRPFTSVLDLIVALAPTPQAAAWIRALGKSYFAGSDWLLSYGCDNNNGMLDPGDFMISTDAVEPAPNHKGINVDALDISLNSTARDLVESGGFTELEIDVPITGLVDNSNSSQVPVVTKLTGAQLLTPIKRHEPVFRTGVKVLRYSTRIAIEPVTDNTKPVVVTALVTDPLYLRRWSVNRTFDLTFPRLSMEVESHDNYKFTVRLRLRSGYRVIYPVLEFRAYHKYVRVEYATDTHPYCMVYTTHVNCTYPYLTQHSPYSPPFNVTFIPPPYYTNELNVTASVNGMNYPLATASYRAVHKATNATDIPVLRRPSTMPPTTEAVQDASIANIFTLHRGNLHFVIITMIVYLVLAVVLTIVQVVLQNRGRPMMYDFTRVTTRDALLTRHTWISMFRPCHYRCLVVHLTGIMTKVFGLYMWCSLMSYLTQQLPSVHFVIGGFIAAMCQMPLKPLNAFMFYTYTTVGDKPYDAYEDVIYYDDSDDIPESDDDSESNDSENAVEDDLRLKALVKQQEQMIVDMENGGDPGMSLAPAKSNFDNGRRPSSGISANRSTNDQFISESSLNTMDGRQLGAGSPIPGSTMVIETSIENGVDARTSRTSSAGSLRVGSNARRHTANTTSSALLKMEETELYVDDADDSDAFVSSSSMQWGVSHANSIYSPGGTTVNNSFGLTSPDSFNENQSIGGSFGGFMFGGLGKLDDEDDGGSIIDVERGGGGLEVVLEVNSSRRLGYFMGLFFAIGTGLVTFLNTVSHTTEERTLFWCRFAMGVAFDFALTEPIALAIHYFYRWLMGTGSTVRFELHPYEGEIRY